MIRFSLLVYDVTKRESFTNLAEVWTKEIEANSTNKDCVKILVGNKADKVPSFPETKSLGFVNLEMFYHLSLS
jgi:Ras-related protein Rab-18